MTRASRVRWWLEDLVVSPSVVFEVESTAIEKQGTRRWKLGRYTATDPHDALRWLDTHLELHAQYSESPGDGVVWQWINDEAAHQQAIQDLLRGRAVWLQVDGGEVDYHLWIQQAVQYEMRPLHPRRQP